MQLIVIDIVCVCVASLQYIEIFTYGVFCLNGHLTCILHTTPHHSTPHHTTPLAYFMHLPYILSLCMLLLRLLFLVFAKKKNKKKERKKNEKNSSCKPLRF